MMTAQMSQTSDLEKLKNLIHYVAYKCDPAALGAVKLNKVLWYSDMVSFLTTGKPIANAKYIKQPLGPVASGLMPAVAELSSEGRVLRREMVVRDHRKVDYLALEAPEISAFTPEEIDIVQDVIQFVCHENTARTISQFSHDEIWEMAELGEEISFKTALAFRHHPITVDDLAWAQRKMKSVA